MAIALRRMMMRLMGFGVVVVLVLAVASSSTTTQSDESPGNAKANSWIIKGPTRPIRPGSLPPGGMLLMTMDPNATMPDAMTNETEDAASQAPATEVSVTSEEPAVETEAPQVDESEPEATTASVSAESEQPASEEPLVTDAVDSSSAQPLADEELVTSQPEEAPATEIAQSDEGTESPQSDTQVENIQPEAESPEASDLTHQELITTELPEVPQSDDAQATEGPEEPIVAALAQDISGVTTLVPEDLSAAEASQDSHDEASQDSSDAQHSNGDVVAESPALTTESDIVELDLGNGVFTDSTLIQVDPPASDASAEGSGAVFFDPESGSGQEIHLVSDEGSGFGLEVALGELDEAEGSGHEGSGDVVQVRYS